MDYPGTKFYRGDGSLSMTQLIEDFIKFYYENSHTYVITHIECQARTFSCLPMYGYMLLEVIQRIMMGSGHIYREHALGRRSVTLFVTWNEQNFVLELKSKHGESTLSQGLEQVAEYMDKAQVEGHLIILKSWEEKISHEVITCQSKTISVWSL